METKEQGEGWDLAQSWTTYQPPSLSEDVAQPLEPPCSSRDEYLLVRLLTLEIDLNPAKEQSLSEFLVLSEFHLNSW